MPRLRALLIAVVCTSALALAAPTLAQALLVTSNVTQNTAPGKSTAVVSYQPPNATNDGSTDLTGVTCTPASGSTFVVGDTTVNCTASATGRYCEVTPDPVYGCSLYGTIPISETGAFKVTVIDREAPVLSQPADVIAAAPPGAKGVIVPYTLPSATDNVGVTSIACAPPSGSSFAVGVTAVNCTAKDAAGNSTSKMFNLIVTGGQTGASGGGTGPRANVCVVPALVGKNLKAAKRVLGAANCTLGKVKGHGKKVKKQSRSPGTELPAGTKVNLKLG